MPDNCKPSDCPVNERVNALEKEFDRYRSNSTNTHREMFDRIGALEQNGSAVSAKLDGMDDKLDTLTEAVNSLAEKPGKRWDSLVDKLLFAAAGAVIAWISAGMPGMG